MLYKNFLSQQFNKLFPQTCFLCGALTSNPLCAGCLGDLPYLDTPLHSIKTFGHLNQAYALFEYDYPVNYLIQHAKFNSNLVILHFLGTLMAKHLNFEYTPDVIMPVPLHYKRLRSRGYNQSLQLAQKIRFQLNLPLDYTHCQRIRNTTPQAKLDNKARLTNLIDAFVVKPLPANWKHILLVDDVLTTGSTVDEISKTLLAAGAEYITVWCCAARFIRD